MGLIDSGLSTRLAARRLQIQPRTVEKHVERALRKLGARSRIEALAILRYRSSANERESTPVRPSRT
jgi:DNA-binding NarL/FixJ family response regulator